MGKTQEPSRAHQAFMQDMRAVVERYDGQGMPAVEQMAVVAQLVGQIVSDIPEGQFSTAEISAAIAGNIEAGNAEAAKGRVLPGLPGAGLIGFDKGGLQ